METENNEHEEQNTTMDADENTLEQDLEEDLYEDMDEEDNTSLDDYTEELSNELEIEDILTKEEKIIFLFKDGTWKTHTCDSEETANKIMRLFFK